VKEFWKSVKNWQSYRHEFGVRTTFWDIVYLFFLEARSRRACTVLSPDVYRSVTLWCISITMFWFGRNSGGVSLNGGVLYNNLRTFDQYVVCWKRDLREAAMSNLRTMVTRWLVGWLSITFIVSKQVKKILWNCFSPFGSLHAILGFPYEMSWLTSNWVPLNGDVECSTRAVLVGVFSNDLERRWVIF